MKNQSGTYEYRVDGAVPVTEDWKFTQGKDGVKRVFAVRRSSPFDIQIELTGTVGADFQCYEFNFQKPSSGELLSCGCYKITEDFISFRKACDDDWSEEPLGDRLFFPIMRVFTGDLLNKILARGGEADVIVPFIANPDQVDRLFIPTTSRRKAWLLDAEEGHYRYLGGHYQSPVDVWLNRSGIMKRYIWQPETGPSWDCRMISV